VAHLQSFHHAGAHRLIPSKYSRGSVLENLPLPPDVLAHLSEIDAATNERKVAEQGGNTAIGPSELLFGVPYAQIVNAAFCHPGPHGGRFNSSQRGAWYAGLEIETSIAEVTFHRKRFLADARIRDQLTFTYVDFLADFMELSTTWRLQKSTSAFVQIRCHSAIKRLRILLTASCMQAPMESFIRAYVVRLVRASRASGRRLYLTCVRIGNIK
jgi:RES domain-containing protein